VVRTWLILLCVLYNAIWLPIPMMFEPSLNSVTGTLQTLTSLAVRMRRL
jgi:hypothetical protein